MALILAWVIVGAGCWVALTALDWLPLSRREQSSVLWVGWTFIITIACAPIVATGFAIVGLCWVTGKLLMPMAKLLRDD